MTTWIRLAALFAALGFVTGNAMADEHAKQARTVTVSGSGEVRAAPDKAIVSMSIDARAPEQATAKSQVNDAVDRFLRVARKLGIADKDLTTSGLQVNPEFDYDNKTRERRLIGYYVSRSIRVDLDDLSKLGSLLEDATDAGVTNVSPPQLDSSRRDQLTREALAKAAADARANAETLAKTLGARVGPPRRISTADLSFQPPPMPHMMEMSRGAVASKSADQSYETGEMEFSARVNAEFDLLVN